VAMAARTFPRPTLLNAAGTQRTGLQIGLESGRPKYLLDAAQQRVSLLTLIVRENFDQKAGIRTIESKPKSLPLQMREKTLVLTNSIRNYYGCTRLCV
jgi:hypothetical protein